MSERPDPRPVAGAPRWMRLLLAVSLAGNLAVLGLAAGAMLRHSAAPGAHTPPVSAGAALYRALPRDQRQVFRAEMRARSDVARDPQPTKAGGVITALRAQPFDLEDLSDAMRAETRRREVWQEAVREVWLARIAAMDDSARAAYADRLEELGNRPQRPHRRANGRGND